MLHIRLLCYKILALIASLNNTLFSQPLFISLSLNTHKSKIRQDRQCTFNITLWCTCMIVVAVETHCTHFVFFPPVINETNCRKNLLKVKCVSCLFLQILSKILHILRRIQKDIIINVHSSSCKILVLALLVRFQ